MALEDFRIQKQILSKFYIGQLLLTDTILDCIRRQIRKLSPEVKVTNDEIREVITLDVLKRDVFDDEKADEARKKINKCLRSANKKDTRPKA